MMKNKNILIVVSICVMLTLVIKALEIIKGDYSTDKFLVILWSLIALFYCLRSNKTIRHV